MNRPISLLLVALFVLGTTMSVKAHDPSEHLVAGEAPDCAAMHQSGGPTMNMKDPVVQAMMKKCKKSMHIDDQTIVVSDEAIKSDAAGNDEGRHKHDKGNERTL